VVGEALLFAAELLDGVPEAFQVIGVVHVGGGRAHLRDDLSQDGAAEAVLAVAEVDEQQGGVAGVGDAPRGQAEAGVGDGREGGDDERGGRGDACLFTGGGVFPDGAHAHGILADRDGDAELGAEVHADGGDGGVEVGAVAGLGGGGHPVGGEVDLAEVAD